MQEEKCDVEKIFLTFVAVFLIACCLKLNFVYAEGCNCWIVNYNERWVDSGNPSSGEHAVAWFQCNKANSNPIVTTDLPWSGYKRNWMVWDKGANHPMVFVDGYYYWPKRLLGWQPWEVFYTVHLK